MLTKFARPFIRLGERINEVRTVLYMTDSSDPSDGRDLDAEEKKHLSECIESIAELCSELELEVSQTLFSDALDDPPKTFREFNLLIRALYAEIKNKLFVFVPTHRKKFMQPRHFMVEATKKSFPSARIEMAHAGRCHAVGMYTAAVFHSIRAVEIGLRAMATSLNVAFPFPLEQADQENVISQIESKIVDLKKMPKSAQKDEDQNFYSKAAIEFRYFKDGWRVRMAHTRETYKESQALGVIEHAASFLGILATRLKEPGV